MLTISAPAKLNLTLEVTGARPDGYHEIRSIVQTLNFGDTILLCENTTIAFNASAPVWQAGMSLVSRAVARLQAATGCQQGAAIGVIKNIPLLSGLGGDSSDAAAVLVGLNTFWKLGLPPATLLALAADLGSDVPLFFYGGTLFLAGRGEMVTPLPSYPDLWAVILLPPVQPGPGKTAALYTSLPVTNYTNGEMTEALAGIITRDETTELNMNEWGIGEERYTGHLFNVFESIAFAHFPGLEEARRAFLGAGAPAVHLTGTGPALFSLFFNAAAAEKVYTRLKENGRQCYLTGFRNRPVMPER
jgi:4-diphosphocytidyl-2-C-methyl-D-erythritol kinase